MMYCSKIIVKSRNGYVLHIKLCQHELIFHCQNRHKHLNVFICFWKNSAFLIWFLISETIWYWHMYAIIVFYVLHISSFVEILNSLLLILMKFSQLWTPGSSFLDMNHTHVCLAIFVGFEDRTLLFALAIAFRNISPLRPRPSWNLWGCKGDVYLLLRQQNRITWTLLHPTYLFHMLHNFVSHFFFHVPLYIWFDGPTTVIPAFSFLSRGNLFLFLWCNKLAAIQIK
jgi:hypothetical protein